MRTAAGHPMVVTVKAPASLPRLPAAVEVAAYRIATVHARTGRRRDSGVFMSLSFLYGVRRHRAGRAGLAEKQRFDGKTALEMLRTEAGEHAVEEFLIQIDEGMFV